MNIIKKSLLVLFVVFGCACGSAQEIFENGYFVSSSGKRTEAGIHIVSLEDLNAKDAMLSYRIGNGETERVSVASLIEVGVGQDIKMMKFEVDLDDSDYLTKPLTGKYPEYKAVTVFLNVLLESGASLYKYQSPNGDKFFYSLAGKGNKPEQLIYKKYVVSDTRLPRENTTFRQQLFDNLKCSGDDFAKFKDLSYRQEDLLRVVKQYNECNNSQSRLYENQKRSSLKMYFAINAGVNMIAGTISGVMPNPPNENGMSYCIGGELELRGAGKKWAGLAKGKIEKMDLAFEGVWDISEFTDDVQHDRYIVDGIMCSFGIGARRYLNAEGKNKFFGEIAVEFNIPISDLKFERRVEGSTMPTFNTTHKMNGSISGSAALGYLISNHFGIEINGNFGRQLMNSSQNIATIRCSSVGVGFKYIF